MANQFDQFDNIKTPDQVTGNPFDQFDKKLPVTAKAPVTKEAYGMGPLGGALANIGTSMIAKPVSDVAGLAAMGKELVAPTPGGGDPEGFKRHVQEQMTYQPRSELGQAITKYNPMALIGQGVSATGQGVGNMIRSNFPSDVGQGVGNAVQEGINQAPGLVGMRYGAPALKGASEGLRGGAESLMQSALKPSMKALKSGDAATAIDTLLDQGINVSKGGVAKLRAKITELDNQIADAVKNNTGSVRMSSILPYIKEKLDTFSKQANPKADMAAIKAAWDEFKTHPLLAGKNGQIPVPLAQELKQGTYKQLSKKYGEMGEASVEAQKAIARGLKEGVADNAPEIVDFNNQESRLIRTLSLAERRVLMDANRNPLGVSLLTKNPANWAAFMLDKSATFKSMMARVLNATGDKIPKGDVAAPAAGIATSQYAQKVPGP